MKLTTLQKLEMLKLAQNVCDNADTMTFEEVPTGIDFRYEYGSSLKTAKQDIEEEFSNGKYTFTAHNKNYLLVEPK